MKYDEVYKKNFFVHYQNLLWSGTYIGLQDPLSEKNHQRKEKIGPIYSQCIFNFSIYRYIRHTFFWASSNISKRFYDAHCLRNLRTFNLEI